MKDFFCFAKLQMLGTVRFWIPPNLKSPMSGQDTDKMLTLTLLLMQTIHLSIERVL